MGIRIAIGAIIAVLLGGTGYFAQQTQSTKNLLQQRELALSREKDSSAKLNLRFKTIEQQMQGLQSRLEKEGTSAKTEIQEMSRLIAEKSASVEQEKAKTRSLELALQQVRTNVENGRKTPLEAEKSNTQSIEFEKKRAEEMARLEETRRIFEAQIQKMSQLITEKTADSKEAKTQSPRPAEERKPGAKAEDSNAQNAEFAKKRTEEIARLEETRKILEAQVQEMGRLIAGKNTDTEQEKTKAKNIEFALKQTQTALAEERKTRAKAEDSNAQNTELAKKRAEEIARLAKARETLDTRVEEMGRLIAEKNSGIEQQKAKTQNIENALKMRTEEMDLLAKAKELLGAQVQEISRLIAEKNSGIEQQKAKTLNIENALKMRTEEKRRKTPASNSKKRKPKTSKMLSRCAPRRWIASQKPKSFSGSPRKSQVQEMSRLIAEKNSGIEQQKAKTQNIENALKMRTEEMDRLAKAKELLGAQVQEMGRLIAEKNSGIEQQKAKTQNIENALKMRTEEMDLLAKAKELLGAQVQEMSQLIAEKTSVAELIKNKLNQTSLSLAETIKKHTLAIARSKILEQKAREEAERSQKLKSDLNQMNSKLKEQFITLRRTKDLLRVTIVNSLLFDSGSAEIKGKGTEALSRIAEFLQKQKDKTIRIEGHTDNQPIKGNLLARYPTNWELSAARAISVVKFLESKNIAPKRLTTIGHSFHRPEASNDTEEGRAKNRRIVILLSKPLLQAGVSTP